MKMNDEPKVTVFYEKFYIDTTYKHIPELFSKNEIEHMCLKEYWADSIDAFQSNDCITYLTCINGDLRVIFPYCAGNGYKFSQYFISGVDGKCLKIPYNTMFGIHNIGNTKAILLEAESKEIFNTIRESRDIFSWDL